MGGVKNQRGVSIQNGPSISDGPLGFNKSPFQTKGGVLFNQGGVNKLFFQ